MLKRSSESQNAKRRNRSDRMVLGCSYERKRTWVTWWRASLPAGLGIVFRLSAHPPAWWRRETATEPAGRDARHHVSQRLSRVRLPFPNRAGKRRRAGERQQSGRCQPPEEFRRDQVTLRLKFDLLRPIDRLERALDRVGVRHAKEFSPGYLGDLSQRRLVEVRHHAPITHLAIVVVVDGHRHVSVFSRTNRVNRKI